MIIVCKGNPLITVEVDDEEGDLEEISECYPDDPLGFIGFALHAVQQGVATSIKVGTTYIFAINIEQTCGTISEDETVLTTKRGIPGTCHQKIKELLCQNG